MRGHYSLMAAHSYDHISTDTLAQGAGHHALYTVRGRRLACSEGARTVLLPALCTG